MMEIEQVLIGIFKAAGVFSSFYVVPFLIARGIADGSGKGKKYQVTINNNSERDLTTEEIKAIVGTLEDTSTQKGEK